MPQGRPTLYDPKYCEEVVDFMSQGYSVTAFAGSIGVSRQTIYEWAGVHESFSDALNEGRARSAVWWENTLRTIASGGEGNATAAIFGLKNRVADEWRDKSVSEIEGKLQVEDVTKCDADAFTRAIAGISAGSGTGASSGGTDT